MIPKDKRNNRYGGHSLRFARQWTRPRNTLREAFVRRSLRRVTRRRDVVYPATDFLSQATDCFEQKQKTILGVQRVDRDKVNKYGIVTAGRSEGRVHEVISLVEKPNVEEAPSNIAVLGRYVITPEIFTYLETQEPGAGGEIQLTDALMKMCRDHGMYAYEFEGKRYDIGDKLGYLEATVEYALRDPVLSDGFKAYLKKISSKL